jgi:hypothetical protein
MVRTICACISLAVVLAITSAGSAAIIAADDFNSYTTGTLVGQGSAGGGWTGAWTGTDATDAGDVAVVTGGLSYNAGGISIDGGAKSVEVTDVNSVLQTAKRSFTPAQNGDPGADVFFRFLTSVKAGDTANQEGALTGLLNDATLVCNGGIYSNTTPNTDFRAWAANSNTHATPADGGTLVAGDVYLIVARFWVDPDNAYTTTQFNRLDLWINPDTTDTLTSYDLSSSRKTTNSIGTKVNGVFIDAWSQLEDTDVYGIDEYVVGETWADVIPEPATLGLMGLGGLALLRRKK